MKSKMILAMTMSLFMLTVAASCRGTTGYGLPENASNGQRIYFTARNLSGEVVSCTGGPPGILTRSACVHCHRADGRGNTALGVPAVTWDALTGTAVRHPWFETVVSAHEEAHARYTDETLKKAIMEGVSPEGHVFSMAMPRWHLDPADLEDMVLFLKGL